MWLIEHLKLYSQFPFYFCPGPRGMFDSKWTPTDRPAWVGGVDPLEGAKT